MSFITSYEEKSSTRRVATVLIPAERVKEGVERVARELGRNVRIPGFRAGKVPISILKARFGDEIRKKALETLLQASLSSLIIEKRLDIAGDPAVSDLKFELEGPLSFTASLDVHPDIVPKDYRGLKVPAETISVSEEEIDGVVQSLRENHATYEPIEDRPAADGDFALVDIDVSFPEGDGEDFKREKILIEIGAGNTLPEMSAHLRNAEPGIAFAFEKRFEVEEQGVESAFAGKTVRYSVRFESLKKRVLPPLDDEFARLTVLRQENAPEDLDLPGLRVRIADSIRGTKEAALREKRQRAVLDGLLALNPVEAPESMVKEQVEVLLRDYAHELGQRGVDLKSAVIDWSELRRRFEPTATRKVKEYLLLDAVGKAENIVVEEEALRSELRRHAALTGASPEELRHRLARSERLGPLREELRLQRVLEFLTSEAVTAA